MRILVLSVATLALAACGGDTSPASNSSGEASASPAAISLPDLSGAYVWKTDYANSSVTYRAVQSGTPFIGEFTSFETAIRLNPDDLSNASITAIIDIASGNAGDDAERNEWFPSDEWINKYDYPKAIFSSTSVKSAGGNAYEAIGTLTLKGVTNPVTLPFTLDVDGNSAHAQGSVTLNRIDYNIGKGGYNNENDVKFAVDVMVDIKASR